MAAVDVSYKGELLDAIAQRTWDKMDDRFARLALFTTMMHDQHKAFADDRHVQRTFEALWRLTESLSTLFDKGCDEPLAMFAQAKRDVGIIDYCLDEFLRWTTDETLPETF